MLFTLSDTANEMLIQRLEQSNVDLRDLLGHGLRMESLRVPKKPSTNAKYYERIHDCAKSLYNTLRQSFTTWPCGCSMPHKANLRLETRQPSIEPSDKDTAFHFNVVFSFEADIGTAAPLPWNWRETKIELVNQLDQTDLPLEKLSLTSKHRRKRVAFAPTEPRSIERTEDALYSLQRIDCLCKAMQGEISRNQRFLGVLVDELQRHHRISVKEGGAWGNKTNTVSLNNLLTGPAQIEKRERLALGVKLASTLLQLQRTVSASS